MTSAAPVAPESLARAEMLLSVVVATHNRGALLRQLLESLARQTLSPTRFEVVVVDDGSSPPAADALGGLSVPFGFTLLQQAQSGAATARHLGIGTARGDVVVVIDDDMLLPEDFLAEHLRAHEQGAEVVLGNILPSPEIDSMPLFERFHARQLTQFAHAVESDPSRVRGVRLCTGNMSVRRALYAAVGGFDLELQRSEDRELGIRLEKAGARIRFAAGARSVHRSDHEDLDVWLGRALRYGIWDSRIAVKHAELESADPWRFLFLVSPLSRALLLGIVALPALGRPTAHGLMASARLADRLSFERPALAITTLAYGMEYFRGVRESAGSLRAALRGLSAYWRKRSGQPRASA
jgi:GT2 family glycosyltransferase